MSIQPITNVLTGASRTKYRSYKDLPLTIKQEALRNPLLERKMLSRLPDGIAELFRSCFLNPNRRKAEELKEYFSLVDTSIVTYYIINHKPSSHKALEPLYNKEPVHLVDQYFYASQAGDAIPDRLNMVVSNFPFWLRELARERQEVKVLVPGSGPAQDFIKILAKNPDLLEKITITCVDNEPDALELGSLLAKQAGVAHKIAFIKGDLMKLSCDRQFDMVSLVGIICPLQLRTSISVVCQVAKYCKLGGIVAVSAVLQKMLINDPATCFVMDFIGWKMDYKTDDELIRIISKSGLYWAATFTDKYFFHRVVIGRVV